MNKIIEGMKPMFEAFKIIEGMKPMFEALEAVKADIEKVERLKGQTVKG